MFIAESTLKMGQIVGRTATDSGYAPILQTLLHDDIALLEDTGALVPTQRSIRRNTAGAIAITSAVYADVPQLAVLINRIGAISFDYWLPYTSSDVAEGIGVQLAFTGTATGVVYSVEAYTDPATRADLVMGAAFASGLAPYASGPGLAARAIVRLQGSCVITAVGTLNLQVRAKTGGAQSVTLLNACTARVSG